MHVLCLEVRPHGQGNHAVAEAGGVGIAAGIIAVFALVVGHPGHGLGIVDAGADTLFAEVGHDLRAFRHQGFVEQGAQAVVAALEVTIVGLRQDTQAWDLRKGRCKGTVVFLAFLQEAGQFFHLLDADGGVDLAHPVVEAKGDGVVDAGQFALAMAAVDAKGLEAFEPFGELAVAQDDHAAFGSGEVFDRVEREDARVAEQADVGAVDAGTRGERAVFEHEQVVLLGDGDQARHVDRDAEVVHHGDGLGGGRDRGFDRVDVDVAGVRFGIDEDRAGAGQLDGMGGGDVGLRRDDDFIAGAVAEGEVDQVHAGGAGGDADRAGGAGKVGEGLLELRRDRAVDEDGAVEHLLDGVLFPLVDQRAAEGDVAHGERGSA